jgi:hypothetical protein
MPIPDKQMRPTMLRLRITAVSLLSILVTTACTLMRQRSTPTPVVLCYKAVAPAEPPTPTVFTCYTAPPPTVSPTPTAFTSPLPTPTPTSTPTPEARLPLLERLVAEGRFPDGVADNLEG